MSKDTEITDISDLPNKDFKAAIIKVFQQTIKKSLETKKFKQNLIYLSADKS